MYGVGGEVCLDYRPTLDAICVRFKPRAPAGLYYEVLSECSRVEFEPDIAMKVEPSLLLVTV